MTYKLSPSSLNLFNECPRCFWLHINKGIKRPAGIFPSLPGGMDRILKVHFDKFMEQGKFPPELQENDCVKGCKLFDDAEKLKLWRNNFKGIQWTDKEGNILMGAVDNLLQKGDKLIVLDFKTRGAGVKEDTAQHYQNQLNIYNFLLQKNGHKTEDYAYLLFYHPTSVNDDGSVIFTTELIRMDISISNAEKLFKKAIEVLKGKMPKSAEECEYCKWVEKHSDV
jgi:hypothetical protein